MTRINITIRNRRQLQAAFRRAPNIAERHLQRGIDAAGATLAKNTQRDNPVPWRTGNLLQSFRARSGRLQHRWFPTANYALFLDQGTRFMRPRRFMQKIADKSQRGINEIFNTIAGRITSDIARKGK